MSPSSNSSILGVSDGLILSPSTIKRTLSDASPFLPLCSCEEGYIHSFFFTFFSKREREKKLPLTKSLHDFLHLGTRLDSELHLTVDLSLRRR
jgi:hypothetical protein